MMVPFLALSLLTRQEAPAPTAVPPRLVGASMFKNGFAITQRVVEVAKPGATVVMPIPSGALGTLWFTPSEGMELESVVVENESVPLKGVNRVSSIEEVLNLNLDNAVTLVVAEKDGPPSRLTGKLVSASGTVVVVEGAEATRAIPKSTVLSVEGKGLKWSSAYESAFTRRVMRIVTSGRSGHVGVVALERGLSWSPGYAVNLQPDGKTLTIVLKATVVNDLEPLKDLDCRFVTGFPNLPFANQIDPLVELNNLTRQDGMVGIGGFGAQAPSAFANAERSRGGNVGVREDDAKALQAASDGEALGELFFYPRKGVSVGLQGRGAYTLFATTTGYETVYAWDLSDPAPGQATFTPRIPEPGFVASDEIWQTLRFANNTRVPFTTAPATTFQEGEILGQDTLRYVSPGQTAELRVTRSLDVSTDFTEEEDGRERGFVKRKVKGGEEPVYDRVTAKGTLTIVNRKTKAVRMRIRKPFTGIWVSGEGAPRVTATAAGLRLPNPTGFAEWIVDVQPGATAKLTYRVRLLVNS